MNRREAKRLVCRDVAAMLERRDAAFLVAESDDVSDRGRIEAAYWELVDELWHRSGWEPTNRKLPPR